MWLGVYLELNHIRVIILACCHIVVLIMVVSCVVNRDFRKKGNFISMIHDQSDMMMMNQNLEPEEWEGRGF
jgi:hypothetical protein